MKSLKIFSSLALFCVLIFTACTKQESLELPEINNTQPAQTLADALTNDVDFIEATMIRALIEKDFNSFYQAHKTEIEVSPGIFSNFVDSYTKYNEELGEHSNNLVSKYPQLFEMEENKMVELFREASTEIIGNVTSRAPCDCYDCYDWLQDQDYAAYLSRLALCTAAGSPYAWCNFYHYNIFLQASASNYDWWVDCMNGVTECDFISNCGGPIIVPAIDIW